MTRDRSRKKAIRARMAARGEPYSVAARKLAASRGDDAAVCRAVIACANNTLAAPSARLEVRLDTEFIRLKPRERRRPGPLGRLTRFAAKAAWQRIAPGVDAADLREAFKHLLGEGFIEPAAGRYLIDYGDYAQMFVDGKRFGGQSGQPLRPRNRDRGTPDQLGDPLTVLALMREAAGARHVGDETVRETICRMITVRAGSSELTVWIDDKYIRRIQSEDRASKGDSSVSRRRRLELWDFGVSLDSLDWSRLPSFRLFCGESPSNRRRPSTRRTAKRRRQAGAADQGPRDVRAGR